MLSVFRIVDRRLSRWFFVQRIAVGFAKLKGSLGRQEFDFVIRINFRQAGLPDTISTSLQDLDLDFAGIVLRDTICRRFS